MNWNWVTERIATGSGVQTSADAMTLINAGITHVIDCRTTDDFPLKGYSQITYLWNPTEDNGIHDQIKQNWIRKSLRWALPLFPQPWPHIYCHCDVGHNRGPSTAYAIMRGLGWSHDEAKIIIETKHPVALGGIAYADDADKVISIGW